MKKLKKDILKKVEAYFNSDECGIQPLINGLNKAVDKYKDQKDREKYRKKAIKEREKAIKQSIEASDIFQEAQEVEINIDGHILNLFLMPGDIIQQTHEGLIEIIHKNYRTRLTPDEIDCPHYSLSKVRKILTSNLGFTKDIIYYRCNKCGKRIDINKTGIMA